MTPEEARTFLRERLAYVAQREQELGLDPLPPMSLRELHNALAQQIASRKWFQEDD